MRYMIIALLLVMATAASAASNPTPREIVFGYECGQINTSAVGFTCEFKGFADDAVTLRWKEDPMKMDDARKARAIYEFEKLALRFFSLGGDRFTLYTASGERRGCHTAQGARGMDFFCQR